MLCEYYNIVVVNAEKIPRKTLGEFIELLRKANPGKYNFACNGARLGIELWKIATGTDVTIVPYRGAADAITGLLRGDADFMIVNPPGLTQHIASGKLRALAFTGPSAIRPARCPTTAEAGWPQYTYSSFFGAYVPAATRPPTSRGFDGVQRDHRDARSDRAIRQQGALAVQTTPEEAARRYQGDIAKYKDTVVSAKIPPAD